MKWVDPAFVSNELYTEKELRRYCKRLGLNFESVCASCFVKREISKKKFTGFSGADLQILTKYNPIRRVLYDE